MPQGSTTRTVFCQNSAWTNTGTLPFAEISIGQTTALCRSQEFHLDRHRHFAISRNSAWTSNGNPPVAGISFGRATAEWRSRKFCLDSQRQSAVRRNFTWTDNGTLPLAGISLGRVTAECRSRKFCLDKQRQSAVRRKSPWTSTGTLPFAGISLGQTPAFCRSQKFCLDKQRHSAAGQNSSWSAKTPDWRRPTLCLGKESHYGWSVILPQGSATRMGGRRFCSSGALRLAVFTEIRSGQRKPDRVKPALRGTIAAFFFEKKKKLPSVHWTMGLTKPIVQCTLGNGLD